MAAEKFFRKAVKSDPDGIEYLSALDYAMGHQQKWDEIVALWDGFIARHPTSGRAYLERAGTNYHRRHMQAALSDAKKAESLGMREGASLYRRIQSAL